MSFEGVDVRMISVEVFVGSPRAAASSVDFIFFAFFSFLASFSLAIVVDEKLMRKEFLIGRD